ncbi:MAG TPA: methionine synthase [Mycobacteriales bacterium]
MTDRPWPPGAASGIGSMPGEDVGEALRVVFGELPDLPHLPELPARGLGADMIGRGAAFLVDLPVDVQPSGWRLVDRPGRDLRQARDWLARDADTLEEIAQGYAGALKLQVTGPWTLAAAIELHYGDKVVADPGAVRDLAQSLAEGVRLHVADVRRRLPGARVVLQVDEPSMPLVLVGRVPTASGFGTLAAVEPPVAQERLAAVLAAAQEGGSVHTVVHCCAARPPLDLFRAAGAGSLSFDPAQLGQAGDEQLGAAVEAGVVLWPGVVPATDTDLGELRATAGAVRGLWHRLGFPAASLPAGVVVTPACGLAGASPAWARTALRRVRETGRAVAEDPEG